MRTQVAFWKLLLIALVILTLLTACNSKLQVSSDDFTEINLQEALLQFPNLRVEIYAYDTSKANEGRNFTPIALSLDEVMAKRAAERKQANQQKDVTLDGKALTYSYGGLSGNGLVNVKLDGKTIFKTSYGDDSPVNPVGGLWVVDGKWILELIHIKTRTENNTVYTDTRGDIIVDGKSMNKRFGYDESFNFQILAGKPFYFYKKDGRIGFYFDGQHVQAEFSEVPHYACCSGAARNPFHFQNLVSFFASNNEGNYYVELGVYE